MENGQPGCLRTVRDLLHVSLYLLGLALLYPVWRLFSSASRLIGSRGLRNSGGNLETAVVFYEHPKTNRQVVLVGTIHIAEPAYYAELQRVIGSLADHRILYEGLGRLSEEQSLAMTPAEHTLAEETDLTFKVLHQIKQLMSFQSQRDGLAYAPTWVNTDMSMYQFVSLLAKRKLPFSGFRPGNLTGDWFNDDMRPLLRWIISWMLSEFQPITKLLAVKSLFSKELRAVQAIILEDRNELAWQGIETHLANGNVASIWGADHLTGIGRRLKRAGFQETRREWFTAYHGQRFGFLEGLAQLIAAANQALPNNTSPQK